MTKTIQPVKITLPVPGTHRITLVHDPAEWWVVMYQDRIVQFSHHDAIRDHVKYTRNGWTQQASAQNQCDQLNQLSRSESFSIRNLQT